jgi:site-specific recombinase XerD
MIKKQDVAGSVGLVVVAGVPLLRPDDQVFEAMLDGWRQQQLSRNLAFATVDARQEVVRRFQAHSGDYPWVWTPQHLEEWSTDLRATRGAASSTVRNYQLAIRSFLAYLCEPLYGWDRECEQRFGTHPVQICHEWNSAVHLGDEGRPGRRALTRTELQVLFDCADEVVDETRRRGRKGFAAAFRDATMLKVAYAWGLRRRELVRLDVHDFGRNPKAPEFGDLGVCYVRFGKANAGGPPKRRSVLTVMGWSVDVLGEWLEDVWPHCRAGGAPALWPSERSGRVSERRINTVFGALRHRAGLPDGLGPHCLRHSYVTHLIEDGFDALFVQQQVGHDHASTTSAYTSVSSDYKTRVLRAALDKVLAEATSGNGRLGRREGP